MRSILPTSLIARPSALLPADALTYRGPLLVRWILMVYLIGITARSFMHLLAADGGAHSIATMDISVAGGVNIVALFGQWGAIQLLLAALMWVLLLRYRGLTSLIAAVLLAEPLLRMLSGHLKPIETIGTAPGAALNAYAIPVMAVLLYLSLCPAEKTT